MAPLQLLVLGLGLGAVRKEAVPGAAECCCCLAYGCLAIGCCVGACCGKHAVAGCLDCLTCRKNMDGDCATCAAVKDCAGVKDCGGGCGGSKEELSKTSAGRSRLRQVETLRSLTVELVAWNRDDKVFQRLKQIADEAYVELAPAHFADLRHELEEVLLAAQDPQYQAHVLEQLPQRLEALATEEPRQDYSFAREVLENACSRKGLYQDALEVLKGLQGSQGASVRKVDQRLEPGNPKDSDPAYQQAQERMLTASSPAISDPRDPAYQQAQERMLTASTPAISDPRDPAYQQAQERMLAASYPAPSDQRDPAYQRAMEKALRQM